MNQGPDIHTWLAARTAEQLTAIIDRRPDACWGAPLRGLDDFASRLVQPVSVAAAVAQLPLPGVELLQAVAALGPHPTIAAAADLLARGDRTPDLQVAAVCSVLEGLEGSALAWSSGTEGIVLNPGLRVVIDMPLGLGRTVASHLEHTPLAQLRQLLRTLGLPDRSRRSDACRALEDFLTDRRRVQELIHTAPAPVHSLLVTLASADVEEQTYHFRDQQDREGESWARRRGLLFGGQYYAAEVPVEVILAVRDGEISVNFDPDPPSLASVQRNPPEVVAAAAAEAAAFTETVAALLDSLARSAIPTLKAGGIGTREVTRTAKALGTDESTVRLALELVRALGLLDGVNQSGVGLHEIARAWRASEPSTRHADLVVAWWGLPVTPSLTHDPEGKAIPAIGGRSASGAAMDLRWSVIDTIGALPTGTGLSGPQSLARHLNWQLPSVIDVHDQAITAVWNEAHALGVLAQGAITPIGAALLAGDPEALLDVADRLLPPASSVGRFGSDLTVMVAGSPAAAVSALLDSCADRESRGAAIVWRFSQSSVRRAFDDGSTADALIGALRSISDAELPQPLAYLIGDVQRRHGKLVVQSALTCVSSDDEALLAEVAAHRNLRILRPRLIAPTVLTFQAEPDLVLSTLRAAGYMPVADDEAGAIGLDGSGGGTFTEDAESSDRPDGRMVRELRMLPARSPGGSGGSPERHKAIGDLAEALLSTAAASGGVVDSDRETTIAEDLVEAFGEQLDPVERRQLAYAIDHQLPVSITYQSASGGTTVRTISDIELTGGLMYAWCHLRDDERAFSIDRVRAVAPVHA